MSRVLDGNIANHLIASTSIAEAATEGTMGVWFKLPDLTFAGDNIFMSTGSDSSGRRWMGTRSTTGYPWAFAAGSSVSIDGTPSHFQANTWQLLLMRKDASGDWVLYVDSNATTPVNDSAFFMSAASDIRLNGSTSGTGAATVKVAHAFVFTRGLTNSEISGLVAGNDPSSIDPAGRVAYYPLADSSLANEWQADSGVGALTVNGTVATDADNPTITTVATVALNQATLAPGGPISGTATNYSAAPTSPISVSDGTNNDDVTVTITDEGNGTYTFTGTMPAEPTVAEGSVTVTVGEASATAVYNDGVTAGISQLIVQQEGSPVQTTDWEIQVKLLSDGTEYYSQTEISSDSQGLIGDIATIGGAVGETAEVLGYSETSSVWFRFFTNLVDLEV